MRCISKVSLIDSPIFSKLFLYDTIEANWRIIESETCKAFRNIKQLQLGLVAAWCCNIPTCSGQLGLEDLPGGDPK